MRIEHDRKLTRLLLPLLKGRGASHLQVRQSLEQERGRLPLPSLESEQE